jgi:hypothetical protein
MYRIWIGVFKYSLLVIVYLSNGTCSKRLGYDELENDDGNKGDLVRAVIRQELNAVPE